MRVPKIMCQVEALTDPGLSCMFMRPASGQNMVSRKILTDGSVPLKLLSLTLN